MAKTIGNRKRFRKQSFKKLAKDAADVGLPFSDQLFKAEDKSVAVSSQYRTQLDVGKIIWKRPKELTDEPHLLYRQKLGPAQEVEFVGDGPNKWFIAAALAIATHKSVLYKVVPKADTHFLFGILKFKFWHLGHWTKVVIDDKLPTFDNQLVFSSSRCHSVFWLPLFEKAYSKLYGSYEAMASNSSLETALIDMTGAMVETIELKSDGKEREQFRMLCEELDKNAILCVKSKEAISLQNTYGLIEDCIYIIKGIKKPSSGTFRKTLSLNKDNIKDASIRIMCTIASTHKKSNFPSNGQNFDRLKDFWIPIDEFCKYFTSVTICRTYTRDRASKLSGNSSNQFCFDVTDDCAEVMIDLMQSNSRQSAAAMGFNLYKIEVNREFKIHNLNRVPNVLTVDALKQRNIFKRIDLISGRYLLQPICTDPEMNVILRVYSHKFSHFKVLSQDMPRHNLLPFVSPKYPKFVTRITIISANILERQDSFGSANPYCVIRCGRQSVKSSPIPETLNPEWNHFSAVFYHNRFVSIIVELWHQSLLIDYFLGRIEVLPKINTNGLDSSLDNTTSIQELQLISRKTESKIVGTIKLQVFTYEDLRAF
ncbi:calpain-6-like [Oppia nitens]|uniref:calpain-6-like n=1 Tax=Oppia nitens TaxID=1686743 RepID=UPI0023DA10A4|nr:calpain-6-like [Oppia nitens]